MKARGKLIKLWAYASIAVIISLIVFLFGFIFYHGYRAISWDFLTQAPKGAILGTEGGIWPAIAGSIWFTGTAVVLGGIPAIASAIYIVFYCNNHKVSVLFHSIIQSIAGIPSIMLGLFSYSFFVRTLGLGRCILSGAIALALMILPFIEVRAEKAFLEIPKKTLQSSYALGCSKRYTIRKIVLPCCRGELVSCLILGGCYAMGATAPLIFTGAVAYASAPESILQPAMALPMHLYLLVAQGQPSLPAAYGTAFVMMIILLLSSLVATIYSRRSVNKWKQS